MFLQEKFYDTSTIILPYKKILRKYIFYTYLYVNLYVINIFNILICMLKMIKNTIMYLNMITYATDIDVNNVPVKNIYKYHAQIMNYYTCKAFFNNNY